MINTTGSITAQEVTCLNVSTAWSIVQSSSAFTELLLHNPGYGVIHTAQFIHFLLRQYIISFLYRKDTQQLLCNLPHIQE